MMTVKGRITVGALIAAVICGGGYFGQKKYNELKPAVVESKVPVIVDYNQKPTPAKETAPEVVAPIAKEVNCVKR